MVFPIKQIAIQSIEATLTSATDHYSFHNYPIGAQLPSGHGPGAYINPLILAPDWSITLLGTAYLSTSQSQLSYQKPKQSWLPTQPTTLPASLGYPFQNCRDIPTTWDGGVTCAQS